MVRGAVNSSGPLGVYLSYHNNSALFSIRSTLAFPLAVPFVD